MITGLPCTSFTFWFALFTRLDFEVVLSPQSSRKLYIKGQRTIPSDTVCYPAKLLHGHVMALLEEKVDAIVNARQVYVFGAGSCKHLAGFLTHYLQLLVGKTRRVTVASPSQICEQMIDLSPEDVVIGISFPRYSKKSVQTLRYAHDKGAGVIALTDSPLSPIAPYAGALLTAHSDMAAIVDSLVAPLSLINALIVAVSLRTMDRVRPKLEELERLWHSYDVYQSVEERTDTE